MNCKIKTEIVMGFKIIDDRVYEKMKYLIKMLHEKSKNLVPKSAREGWLDNQDVTMLLDISPRTLQAYRDRGVIAYSQIGYKCYYKWEDVKSLIEKSKVENRKQLKTRGK